ncbi:hypothetical protein [Streptomyces sp. NPDC003401]
MTTRDNLDTDLSPKAIEGVLRARADSFRYDAEMEKAGELDSEQLSPALRMARAYYEDAKRAAIAAGKDVSDPVPAQSGDRLAAAYRSLS